MSLLNNPLRNYGVPTDDTLGAGLAKDDEQKLTVKLAGALAFTPDGEIGILFDESTLEQSPGSPVMLRAKVAPAQVKQIETTQAESRDLLTSVAVALGTETTDRRAADLAQPQTFLADGSVSFALSPKAFILIDNTAANVTVSVAPFAGYEINVKVIGYAGGNTCRLQPTSGNIETAGFIDYTAALDSARYLCDGTDWWRIQ